MIHLQPNPIQNRLNRLTESEIELLQSSPRKARLLRNLHSVSEFTASTHRMLLDRTPFFFLLIASHRTYRCLCLVHRQLHRNVKRKSEREKRFCNQVKCFLPLGFANAFSSLCFVMINCRPFKVSFVSFESFEKRTPICTSESLFCCISGNYQEPMTTWSGICLTTQTHLER